MKPVLVLQHLVSDGPAWLASWLASRGVPFDVRNSEAGDALPATLADHGALAILGGEMSANDPLPALRQAEQLVRLAVRDGVPTLGHCLGGQLMARALGALVVDSGAPEIGWHGLQREDSPEARAWLGDAPRQTVFQWHYEAFELPAGATRLAGSAACANQAFALGPHLALQFHVELDADKLARWSEEDSPRLRQAAALHRTVQTGALMRQDAVLRLHRQQELASRLYARWLSAAASR